MRNDEILFLSPVFTHNIWGGTRLRDDFNYEIEGDDIGECWGISAHEKGDCTIANGCYKGKKLSELWKERPALFGNYKSERFPLMVKLIDAKEDLSIQVHPDDRYANKHENGAFGKTECWYILDCAENASLVFGHNATDREELNEMMRKDRWNDLIREIPVKKGDFVQIDPGTIHAIKGGMLVLETQQNSDIIYRVYDYGRLNHGKPRQLHLHQSMDVISVPSRTAADCVVDSTKIQKNKWIELISRACYRVWKLNLEGETEFLQDEPFLLMSVVEGCGTVNETEIRKGMHMILPCQYGKVRLKGDMELVASTVGKETRQK